jgi:hypothetical protein
MLFRCFSPHEASASGSRHWFDRLGCVDSTGDCMPAYFESEFAKTTVRGSIFSANIGELTKMARGILPRWLLAMRATSWRVWYDSHTWILEISSYEMR